MKLKLITILFAITVIVLVYILIHVLYSKNALVKQNYLGTGLLPIQMSTLNDYQSTSYYYEIWIYVNSLDNAKPYSANVAAVTNLGGNIFYVTDSISLDLYQNTALYVNVNQNSTTYDSYNVTQAFPLQKWQCVNIHIQNYLMDFYLNGKLVKSMTLTSTNGVKSPSTTSAINFGKTDAYIAKFNRLTSVLTTNIAWQRYLEGNANLVPIHATMTLTSDPDKTVSNYNLF